MYIILNIFMLNIKLSSAGTWQYFSVIVNETILTIGSDSRDTSSVDPQVQITLRLKLQLYGVFGFLGPFLRLCIDCPVAPTCCESKAI